MEGQLEILLAVYFTDKMGGKIRIVKLAHMRYRHADIEGLERFLIDFGLERVHAEGKKRWYAGTGPDPYVYVAEQVR